MNKMQEPETSKLPWDNPRFRNWVAVAKAAHAVERAIADVMKPLDLKPAQLDMMMNIPKLNRSQREDATALEFLVGRGSAACG